MNYSSDPFVFWEALFLKTTWVHTLTLHSPGASSREMFPKKIVSDIIETRTHRTASMISRFRVSLFVAILLVFGNELRAQPPEPRGLEIYFIDVQGGAAT